MPGHYKNLNKVDVDIKDFATTPADQLAIDLVRKKKEELAPKKKIKAYRNDVDLTRIPEPTQLGNVNEDNTLAFILSGGPVIRQGFNLSKNAPNIIKKVLKKGGDAAVKFGDDVVNIVSSLGD
tara:strand:+ start:46 stop:414 length:369 start_codon:yes stop_codon:yes gene_type:complete